MSRTSSTGQSDDALRTSYTKQFEALDIWGRTLDSVSDGERGRVNAIVSSIPAGTQSILDVGCGDGLVTNELVKA